VTASLFADASSFGERFIPDYGVLARKVTALRELGCRIVLTSGSFDLIHEGHSMYLEAARAMGDFLIVGVDSDAKIRNRKGSGRPVVPEMERLRMVAHQRGVGIVTLKGTAHRKWELLEVVRPDVLVSTSDTYAPSAIRDLEARLCGRVAVLSRMATVSTSARLRALVIDQSRPEP
jgi:D-glycero-beta-D-manno-heptose 1-phosphate adenylyltransferase